MFANAVELTAVGLIIYLMKLNFNFNYPLAISCRSKCQYKLTNAF